MAHSVGFGGSYSIGRWPTPIMTSGKAFPLYAFPPPVFFWFTGLSCLFADCSHDALPLSLCIASPLVGSLCLHLFLNNSHLSFWCRLPPPTEQSSHLSILIVLWPVPLKCSSHVRWHVQCHHKLKTIFILFICIFIEPGSYFCILVMQWLFCRLTGSYDSDLVLLVPM